MSAPIRTPEVERLCRRANERVYGGERRGPCDLIAAMRAAGHSDPERVATQLLTAWESRRIAAVAWQCALVSAGVIAPWSGQ